MRALTLSGLPLCAACSLLAFAAFSVPALAHEDHRELGAHVHGHGTFNIAIEDSGVSLELEVPGMDIVGFEHAPANDEQKGAVEKAKALLSEPLTLFALPAGAACKVADAKVELDGAHAHSGEADDEGGHKHADDDHAGHDHEDGDHDHDHAKRDGDKSDADSHGHSQFHATYNLECAKPAQLTSIAFDYFKRFAGAQRLTVNVVTAKGQASYEVSREKPALDIGGLM
ncbi:MAG TPA: DUF2796 domain-containing protein [Hyphomicrobium sp.]|nr:DUF2796 domain-containing protein [Hyphomicrobium sp.]